MLRSGFQTSHGYDIFMHKTVLSACLNGKNEINIDNVHVEDSGGSYSLFNLFSICIIVIIIITEYEMINTLWIYCTNMSAIAPLKDVSVPVPSSRISDWTRCCGTPMYRAYIPDWNRPHGRFGLCDWLSFSYLGPWINHLPCVCRSICW